MSRLAAALTLLAPTWAMAAPIAPAGSDPSGAGPQSLALYASAGTPAAAVGADARLGATVLGLELGGVLPGALRPEIHVRWPLRAGPALFAPRLAVAYSWALSADFAGLPSDSALELAPGLVASWQAERWAVFLDGGELGLTNLRRKQQTRLFATVACGVRLALSARVSLATHVGALLGKVEWAPAAGLTVAWEPGGQ